MTYHEAPGTPRGSRRKVPLYERWLEMGELSQDGAQWRKFFEMTLRRVP
jgi:hypothetical protein